MKRQFVSTEVPLFEEKYNSCWLEKNKGQLEYAKSVPYVLIDPTIGSFLLSNIVPKSFVCDGNIIRSVTVSKMFSFAAAHYLPHHAGKCRFLHGHEWKLRVAVTSPINEEGMVLDFSDLKKCVNTHVIDELDHSFLNQLVVNPTAENLLVYIWNMLQFEGRLKGISKLSLWESDDSKATITARDMSDCIAGQSNESS